MKDILKRVLLLLPLASVLLTAASCSEDDTADRYVLWFPDTTEITYDQTEWADKVYTETLTGYTVIPIYKGYGALQLGVEYTSSGELNVGDWAWSSSDESVAVVNSDGTVYPVGVGQTTIEVAILPSESSADTCRDWIIVTVAESLVLAEEITITVPNNATTVYEGGYSIQLAAEVTKTSSDPLMGNDATYNTFRWSSSNEGIASIDESTGVVTTKSIPISPIDVEFFATTVDGSGVSTSTSLSVIAAIAPDAIYFSDKTMALDGGVLARNIGTFTLEHEMIPADATPGLIEWTSSNESVLTVSEGGVVNFTGAFGYDVTITASCYGSDEVEKITVSVPAGYFFEDFSLDKGDYATDGGKDELGLVRWLWGPQTNGTNQDTDGGVTCQWTEGVDGRMFMKFTSWTQAETERADMMCTQVNDMGLNTTYPFVVWHLDNVDVLNADNSPNQGFNFDIMDTTDGISTYPGGKTTQYTTYKEFGDKTTLFIVMDIREICDTNSDLYLIDFLPTAVNEEWLPAAFNMAHTGLGKNGGDPTTYNFYSVFSLASTTQVESYLEEYMETWENPDPERQEE